MQTSHGLKKPYLCKNVIFDMFDSREGLGIFPYTLLHMGEIKTYGNTGGTAPSARQTPPVLHTQK
jgi:hypothetical protein